MKAHMIEARVFSTPEDNSEKISERFLSFFPFNTEKIVKQKNALGFNNRKIVVISATLKNQGIINKFIALLSNKLGEEQKKQLIDECEQRIDDKFGFYLRFDKQKLVNDNILRLTTKGDCFHIRIVLAPFPKRMDVAINLVKDMLG